MLTPDQRIVNVYAAPPCVPETNSVLIFPTSRLQHRGTIRITEHGQVVVQDLLAVFCLNGDMSDIYSRVSGFVSIQSEIMCINGLLVFCVEYSNSLAWIDTILLQAGVDELDIVRIIAFLEGVQSKLLREANTQDSWILVDGRSKL